MRLLPTSAALILVLLSSYARADSTRQSPSAAIPATALNEAQGWLTHLRACTAKALSLRAKVRISLAGSGIEALGAERATIVLRRDGKWRASFDGATKRLALFDGQTVWAYDDSRDLVWTGVADALTGALGWLFGGGKKTPSLPFFAVQLGTATKPEDGGSAALELTPSTPHPFIAKLVLTVSATCPALKRVLLILARGNVVRVEVEQLELNVAAADTLFRFTPHRRAKVVRP